MTAGLKGILKIAKVGVAVGRVGQEVEDGTIMP